MSVTAITLVLALGLPAADKNTNWKQFSGQPGPTGWRCHVLCPDPADHGPDGINTHDWNNDGLLDVFVNYEEGKYSRLFFNPGPSSLRQPWKNFIEFQHGKCEDSGIGDLDNDGDIDYVANGGWVYFNPGADKVTDAASWEKMTLFKQERRVPTVADVDGDGLNDLIVGAQEWYKQPLENKHDAKAWKKYTVGKNRWPMNCHLFDLDGDGDLDWVVPDRGVETCWYENPGQDKVTQPWKRRQLHNHTEPMFTALADVNDDGVEDLIITGGPRGKLTQKLILLLRTNKSGIPTYHEVILDQPSGNFPKGVAVFDVNRDGKAREIVIIPKQGDVWIAEAQGDATKAANWKREPIVLPGSKTRKKMDNVYVADVDADGDLDFLTTEENGGWGVIWFENPVVSATNK